MKKALITGITGQDGSYLAELLLEGFFVYRKTFLCIFPYKNSCYLKKIQNFTRSLQEKGPLHPKKVIRCL